MIKKQIILIVAIVILSGCSAKNKRIIDCPAGEGMGCKSITKVNEAINKGEIEDNYEKKIKGKGSEYAKVNSKRLAFNDAPSKSLSQDIIRIPEKTVKIWMSGFEDNSGSYIEETYVHMVVEKGRWEEVESSANQVKEDW